MAETSKRSSAGGKAAVATPAVGQAPGMVSLDTALNGAIGARIRIQTTANPQPLEGALFTLCPLTSLLALSTSSPSTSSTTTTTTTTTTTSTTHHIIPLSALTSFTILPPTPANQPPATSVPALKPATLLARANNALNLAKEKASRVNKDVSRDAQEIFDALAKQFPNTRWAGKDMVVMDVVMIYGPGYRGEDVKAGKEGERAVKQVRKVLENERQRMARRDPKPVNVKPVIPAIPAIPAFQGRERKGG